MSWVRDPLEYHRLHGEQGFQPLADGIRLDEALEVYRQNRAGALVQALLSTFGVCRYLLGEELMLTICRNCAGSLPQSQSLERVGAELLPWLRGQPQSAALFADYPFLPALLQWEWGWHGAYYAYDSPPLNLSRCQRWLLEGGSSRPPWRLNSGLTLVASSYCIEALWLGGQRLIQGSDEELQVDQGAMACWAIWPTAAGVEYRQLTAAELASLQTLRLPLRGISDRPVRLKPEHLAEMIQRQWLVAGDAS
ncbi:Putative DNA-binding domain-containing protein [Ferrimonas sediminum]|uniref:Putative DNA-binding domain-containing protein n=1 Tax=Ferrimonas sediminum TaxID=718193 RepID=A0A1G9B3Z7_9GAMM|nr:putative DNA-binding domain-containing protein [Ferrimonas sediminum]SDK34239.1 Putative DNA-binding domain-containing protein [Ferrimonas sediminum]